MKPTAALTLLIALAAWSTPGRAQHHPRPLITGRQAIVVSLDPLASMAGMQMIARGGNAFDAAVATAVAVTVIDMQNASIGGQGFATIYDAKTKTVKALNFFGPAPKAATVAALQGKKYDEGYLATPVPSNLAGYAALHHAHGRLRWADVLQPAIELAEKGFLVTEEFSQLLARYRETFEQYPTSRAIFVPGGRVPRAGDVFVQTNLARTLQSVANGGVDAFYRGALAAQIGAFYKANGGLLTADDLSTYSPRWVDPISTSYRGYQVYTQPPNSSAMAVLLQLNLLEHYDLRALGHNSAPYLHLVGEAMRLTIADRNAYVGDPDFVKIPVAELLSKARAAKRRLLIRPDQVMPTVTSDRPSPDSPNTTHISVVDADGNMVALTQTLGGTFGSGVVAGNTGVLFSNQMRHLHLEPDSPSRVEPGKRPRSNQSPLIVLKDGEPVMALGTPGNDAIWQRLPQVLMNIIDFGMDPQEAVAQPRLVFGDYQETGTVIKPVFNAESWMPASSLEELRGMGHEVKVVGNDGGRVSVVRRDPRTKFLTGGADPRSRVYAIGW